MEDIEHLKKNGFIFIKNLLNDILIDSIIKDFIKVIKRYCDNNDIFYDNKLLNLELLYDMLNRIYNINPELYFNFVKQNGILSEIYNIKSLFTNEKIQDFLKSIGYKNLSVPVTPQMNFFCDFAINKKYRDGKIGLDIHQDWPQTRGSINNIILWIPFKNVNIDSAPLMYLNKPHKNEFMDGEQNSHNIVPTNYTDKDFNSFLMDKGDCLLFNGWFVHKTGEFNNNEKMRIAVSIRFNDLDDAYFISTQYYTAYNVVMNRDKNQSRIPTEDELLIMNCQLVKNDS